MAEKNLNELAKAFFEAVIEKVRKGEFVPNYHGTCGREHFGLAINGTDENVVSVLAYENGSLFIELRDKPKVFNDEKEAQDFFEKAKRGYIEYRKHELEKNLKEELGIEE